MPKIKIEHRDLKSLVGKNLSLKELEKISPNIKCEWIGEKEGEIELETTHDRPDLLSTEGIARAVKNYLGLHKGLQEFKFTKSGLECTVEKNVLKVRPHSRMFIVRDVTLTDALIEQLMQLQEKIHLSYTSGRKNASIGVYDLDSFEFPLTYCTREHINFTPLGETEPMSAQEVLEKTEKGCEYAHLVTPGHYPLILDRKNLVLSMPPILNSEDTRLTQRTHNLFVDVSGEDERMVEKIITLMAVALAERGKVETVTMSYPDKAIESPALKKESMEIDTSYVNKRLGLKINALEGVALLKKSGFNATESNGRIKVDIPCYRFDLMHPIDLVEEIAMAYGYDKIEPAMPEVYTKGEPHPVEDLTEKARDVMVGAGFQEVLTYLLTAKHLMEFTGEEFVELANPVSDEHNAVRNTLIPGLLEVVSENKHYPLPHMIFEADDVVELADAGKTTKTKRKLGAIIVNTDATFTAAKSLLDVIAHNLDFDYKLESAALNRDDEPEFFILGRMGEIKVRSKEIGVIGEIHPRVLNKLGIEHPVAAIELDLEEI